MLLSDDQAKARLAENVRRLLDERNWSQAELARATGENDVRVSALLHEEQMAGAGFIARIAEVFSVSIDYLFAPSREISRESA